MLSTDSQVFNEGSAVRERIKEYGTLVEEIHVIVYTRPGLKEEVMGNVYLWPTNNHFRIGYFRRVYGLAKGVIKNREDWVISSQDPFETGWAAYKLKLRFNIPFQVQVHTDFLSPYFSEMSWKNKFRATLAKWLVKKADNIRVVSERIKNSLVANHQSLIAKIFVLPIFVDLQKFRDALPNEELTRKYGDDFVILTVARLEPEKNLALAIDAVADITLFAPDREWLVDTDKFASKGKNTPLAGSTLKGKVMATIYGGKLVYKDELIAAGAFTS